jgi:hypothetical protein
MWPCLAEGRCGATSASAATDAAAVCVPCCAWRRRCRPTRRQQVLTWASACVQQLHATTTPCRRAELQQLLGAAARAGKQPAEVGPADAMRGRGERKEDAESADEESTPLISAGAQKAQRLHALRDAAENLSALVSSLSREVRSCSPLLAPPARSASLRIAGGRKSGVKLVR